MSYPRRAAIPVLPHPRTLVYRLALWFAKFPDECLTSEDLEAKTGLSHHAVQLTLKAAIDAGWLVKRSIRTDPVGRPAAAYELTPEVRLTFEAPLAPDPPP
jgi:predicted transcriptional regulator